MPIPYGPWIVDTDDSHIYIGPKDSVSGRVEAVFATFEFSPMRLDNANFIVEAVNKLLLERKKIVNGLGNRRR